MTAPERYRKKPVVIDAIQWTGDNLRAVICFTDGPPDTRTNHAGMMWEKYEDLVQREGLKIYTLEGTMKADVGDYIIKGVKGEFYPCKPDIFSATYDRAAVAAALAHGDYFEGLEGGIKIGRSEPQPDPRDKVLNQAMKDAITMGEGWIRTLQDGTLQLIDPSAVRLMPDATDPRDEVIARLVEALKMMQSTYPYNPLCYGWQEQVEAHKTARAALAAAKEIIK